MRHDPEDRQVSLPELPVVDAFTILGQPRQPWLDPDTLKSRFLLLSTEAHPDRFHHLPVSEREAASKQFGELNAAYNCLRTTKTRLQLLLHLEQGRKPREVQAFPDALMSQFAEVSQDCRQVDRFLKQKEQTASPLLKAALAEQGLSWSDQLEAALADLATKQTALETELKEMNPKWETAPPIGSPERLPWLPLVRVEEIYRDISYLMRWTAQIRERLVQLGL